MFRPLLRFVAALALLTLSAASLWGQAQPEKKVKDQAEYDLFAAVTKEQDPNKKILLLSAWKEKYPDSDFKMDRLQIMIMTYQQLRQGDKMLETAQEMVKIDPKSIPGLYWITVLTVSLANTAPERLEIGEKGASGLIAQLDETFAAAKKPAQTSEETWQRERKNLEALARKTLGWVEMTRKNNAKAEVEFAKSLDLNPGSGQVSYWLGSVIAAQRDPKKQVSALFHFARAAHYAGDDALPEAARKQVQAYLEKVYTTFHGNKEGLPELIELTKKGHMPPADLKIKSAVEIAIEQEEELKKTNPQLALWMIVKKELLGPEGPQYFEAKVKGTALPKLKGKLVSTKPEARPKELTLALATADTAEVVLRLDAPMTHAAPPGTELEFDNAVPAEFASDPFLLTLEVDKANVSGWPPPPKKAPTKKAAPKAARKK